MSKPSIDLKEILAEIREQTITIAEESWPGLGKLVDDNTPDPLDPALILPVASGRAAHGEVKALIPAAAAIMLFNLSFRIVDDMADDDNPVAVHHKLGNARAMNMSLALCILSIRALTSYYHKAKGLDALMDEYYRSLLRICQGQDRDINPKERATTLEEYEELVKFKSIPVYKLVLSMGARVITSDQKIITTCAGCGIHLGWMHQIIDDLQSLWFPEYKSDLDSGKLTFPILYGFAMDHPKAKELQEMCIYEKKPDRLAVCALLDEMHVRPKLISLALDHRDRALAAFGGSHLNPEGQTILKLWLDWFFQDGKAMLEAEAIK